MVSGTGLGYYLCTRCGGGGKNTKPGIFCPGTKLKSGEMPHKVVYDMANKIVVCLDCGHNNTYSINSFAQNTFFHQPVFNSEVLSDDELPF